MPSQNTKTLLIKGMEGLDSETAETLTGLITLALFRIVLDSIVGEVKLKSSYVFSHSSGPNENTVPCTIIHPRSQNVVPVS